MPKVLIVYYSRSGNTHKMAQLVEEGVSTTGCEVANQSVEETQVEDLLQADAVILGSPTYYGTMAAEIKQLLDESVKFHGKLQGKVGGAFSSSANTGGGNETTVLDMLKALLIHGMIVPGSAKGDHYGPVAIGAPDERAAKECRRMGKIVGDLTNRLFGG
ncbi:MAG: NAD(P)H-dependent oxidoreductase [Kiritimatiellae bacterium]|nr:NAD(P)H-dependent oxidoreductase [Kiritimatiellia bacterium]